MDTERIHPPPPRRSWTRPLHRAVQIARLVAPRRLAYFVSRFPTTTETFVVRELNAVVARPHHRGRPLRALPHAPGRRSGVGRDSGSARSTGPGRDLPHRVSRAGRCAGRSCLTDGDDRQDYVREPRMLIRALATFAAADRPRRHAHRARNGPCPCSFRELPGAGGLGLPPPHRNALLLHRTRARSLCSPVRCPPARGRCRLRRVDLRVQPAASDELAPDSAPRSTCSTAEST